MGNATNRTLLHDLIERRRKFVDGLDANKGEINLDIFEDFYPDKAHFVYELLQNAEDAGATEVTFTLTPEKLGCEHDGRAFTLADVNSITGLHDSTKANAPDKIGKFGVGFKSVFVYTRAPSIWSGDFAFRIIELILPEPITSDTTLNGRTRFEFPFDNPKKPRQEAYSEIATGLNELDEKSLLFLANIRSVQWRIGNEAIAGEVLRREHSSSHFELLKNVAGKNASSSHFLKFDEMASGLERQRIAIAFSLDFLPGVRKFDPATLLTGQFKIVAAEPGSVAVFFPAVKETSGLRFHLHGPFVPELSRASIKETSANIPLFEQLAALSAKAMHRIKDLGLLTPDFLAVLPNPQDQVPARYQSVRAAIVEEMKSQALTPTHDKGHAPASRLIQARGSLKTLLSKTDLEFLLDYDDVPPLWAIGAAQKNNRIDQFLSGLEIREWGLTEFLQTLRKNAREEGAYFKPDEQFLSWLAKKSPAWFQELYALLQEEAVNAVYQLKMLRIVLLDDGSLSKAGHAFFASRIAADMPIVDKGVYSSGASKNQKQSAKSFLSGLGVREIGEAEQIELILERRYSEEAEVPDDATYIEDLKRFVAFVEETNDGSMFEDYYIFHGADDGWHTPEGIYLDRPFMDTCLSAYYGAVTGGSGPNALHDRYRKCGIEAKALAKFAENVGVRVSLEVKQVSCYGNPEWATLTSAGGVWTSYGINRDYFIPHLDEMLKAPALELSRLIWRTLTSLAPSYLQAVYRNNSAHNANHAASRLVHVLRSAKWVPQNGGKLVRPADALREHLPKGFPFDPGYSWLKSVRFGETAARQSAQAQQKDSAAKSLGFADAAAAERARAFADLPVEEQEQFFAEREHAAKSAVLDRDLANPERRARNVAAQARNAPDKESEIRSRSVSIGREEKKVEAEQYLRRHYRNADGEMTCQICKGPLPFKLEDGTEFFELVEFLPDLRKRHVQNYLALCPNHSAMYRHANGSKKVICEMVQNLTDNELEVTLGQKDRTIYLSQHHVIDIKAVLAAEANPPPDAEDEDAA